MNEENNNLRKAKGCIPSPEDTRDYNLETVKAAIRAGSKKEELPEEYVTPGNVDILDQGCYPTCVAHSLASLMARCECKLGVEKPTNFSRGFIYANRRDDQSQEEGMVVREALKQLNHDGDCLYDDFPYNNYYPNLKAKLEKYKGELLEKASPYPIAYYFRCTTDEEVKQAIYNYGAAIISIPTWPSFGDGPYVHLPYSNELIDGYHAMCCIGWTKTHWVVQNSWGKEFGENGICYIPYNYPIEEWWGVVINESAPNYKVPNNFIKFLNKIKWFFKRLFNIK